MMTEFGKGSGSSIWGKENFCYSHQIIKEAANVVKWAKMSQIWCYSHSKYSYSILQIHFFDYISRIVKICLNHDSFKYFGYVVTIILFDLSWFIKPATYQDHLQIRYKMGFWHTCHVTPQTFAVTSYIFPHRLHYLIMLSDSNEVVYFPRW